jgi:hypothetical protein
VVALYTTGFSIQTRYVLPKLCFCVCVFFCGFQNKQLHRLKEVCWLRGTNWIFIHDTGQFASWIWPAMTHAIVSLPLIAQSWIWSQVNNAWDFFFLWEKWHLDSLVGRYFGFPVGIIMQTIHNLPLLNTCRYWVVDWVCGYGATTPGLPPRRT